MVEELTQEPEKRKSQSRDIDEIKRTTENMEQLELEVAEILKNFT